MPKVSEEYFKKKKNNILDAAFRVCLKKPVASIEMKDVIEENGFSHGVKNQILREQQIRWKIRVRYTA